MSVSNNWLDHFVKEVSNLTDAPELFIRVAAYFAAGSALRKQVFFRVNTNVYPNLYYLLIGPPHRFHKTTALDIARDTLHADCGGGAPLVGEQHFLPYDGSDVAFDLALIESGGYGISYYEEFSKFLGSVDRDYTSGIQTRFLEHFSPSTSDKKSNTVKEKRIIPKGSVINFTSACTDQDFEAFSASGAVSSGLLSRMLIFRPTEADVRPSKDPQPQAPLDFYTKMAKSLKQFIPKVQQQMIFSKDAAAFMKEIKSQLNDWYEAEPNGIVMKDATGRYHVILQRLAMIHASMRGSAIIDYEDIDGPIQTLMNPYLGTVKRFNKFGYVERPDQVLRTRIYHRLENGKAMPIYTIARDLNEPVSTVRTAIEVLKDQGHIYSLKSEGYEFFVAYDDADQDRDTKVSREERATAKVRAKLQEEKVKVKKLKKSGAVYSAQKEGE